jgi:hypothetical protein
VTFRFAFAGLLKSVLWSKAVFEAIAKRIVMIRGLGRRGLVRKRLQIGPALQYAPIRMSDRSWIVSSTPASRLEPNARSANRRPRVLVFTVSPNGRRCARLGPAGEAALTLIGQLLHNQSRRRHSSSSACGRLRRDPYLGREASMSWSVVVCFAILSAVDLPRHTAVHAAAADFGRTPGRGDGNQDATLARIGAKSSVCPATANSCGSI